MGCRRGAAGALALGLGLGLALVSCGGTEPDPPPDGSAPELSAEIVQQRRDEPLERVQVAVTNTGTEKAVVERLLVRIPGFDSGGAVPKDSPIAPGLVVNLPWPYGTVQCDGDGRPSVGRAVVRLDVHTELDPTVRPVRLVAPDPSGVLGRIAVRACTVERIAREVDLRFGSRWRPERGPDGVTLHGTLEARLLVEEPRNITQVAGAILYGLEPDGPAGGVPSPLAALTGAAPHAAIPVTFFAARCDGHTIGEIKKPYEFLVWVAPPGGDEFAVSPRVDQGTKDALQDVCAF